MKEIQLLTVAKVDRFNLNKVYFLTKN